MLGLFTKRRRRQEAILPLLSDVMAVARHPRFYLDFSVEDTFEGRFELLTLIMVLVLRQMRQLPAPAGDAAQELVDAFFASLDEGLRRAGIGDLSVPKRMKKLAQGFYGRAEAYGVALNAQQKEELRIVLARNLYSSTIKADEVPAGLLETLAALKAVLEICDLDALMQGNTLLHSIAQGEPA